MTAIQGYKKGGSSGRIAQEERDSLRSTQLAEVIDAVSEGEIEGLVNGLKSVYLNKVPVENPDGSKNFDNVSFVSAPGSQGQAALPGFNTVQSEVAVGVQVTQATPVVRSITQSSVDAVRVTIGIPQLTTQNQSNGDVGGGSVEFAIDVQTNGGGYVERYRNTITGKTTTRYQRAVRIELPGNGPWDVRVRRISPAAAGSHIQNQTWWDSYTEIQSVKLRYPNTALMGLRVSAQQFNSVPTRSYDLMGLRIQVPTNYNPITRAYSGAWNGTFQVAWTNNPAWVFYALATNERWGLGDYVDPGLVDKWGLYTIAQFCDQLVSDGRGGQEPRFTCNLVLQTRAEAYKVLQDVAAIFRGMAYWAQGTLRFVQDSPKPASHLFGPSNVVDGVFTYSGTSAAQRHSVAIVYWNNPAEHFERVPEVVTDDRLMAKLGVREVELSPIGVTSRAQAARVGRWLLYSEDAEGRTVSFKTAFDGAALELGDVFKVADPNEAGERMGGRIKSATTNAVTLDAVTSLASGTYTLSVMQPDASQPLGYTVEERTVTNAAGPHGTLNVTPAFSTAPVAQGMWLLASASLQATLWRCVRVEETDAGVYEVTGVAHEPNKYAAIEQGMVLEARPISRLREQPLPPTGLTLAETVYTAGASAKSRVTVSWVPQVGGQTYRVAYRSLNGAWANLSDTTSQSVDIDDVQPGPLEVAVRAVNVAGVSLAATGSITVAGRTAMPQPTGLSLAVVESGIQITWDQPAAAHLPVWRDSDLRHSPPGWPFERILRARATRHLGNWLPGGYNQFALKNVDTAGNESMDLLAGLQVDSPSAPNPQLETEVNIVRITWADCRTTQPIKHYEIRRGVISSTAAWIGYYTGTEATVQEPNAGTYQYWIRSVDMGGNASGFTGFMVTVSDRISGSLTALSTGLASTTSLITHPTTGLQIKVADLVTTTNTLSSSVTTINGQMTTLQNDVVTLTSAQAGLISTTNTLSTTVYGHGVNLTTLNASVSTLQTAQAGVAARWGVRLDVNNRITGVILNAGTTQTDAVFLVDKFAIAYASEPDLYPFVVGLVNTVSTVGINGNLVVDGSIFARSLSVNQLSAITANVGTLTAGTIRNHSGSSIIDLSATGSANAINLGNGKFTVTESGVVTADRVNIRRRDAVASGSVSLSGAFTLWQTEEMWIDTGIDDPNFLDTAINQPWHGWVEFVGQPATPTGNWPPPLGTWTWFVRATAKVGHERYGIEGALDLSSPRLFIKAEATPGLNTTYHSSLNRVAVNWALFRL